MERRNFLALFGTTAAGVAANPLAGAMPPLPAPSPLPEPPDMDVYIRRVDAGLESIASWKAPAWADPARAAEAEPIVRAALQSVFLTGMHGDLPTQLQMDPRMQERMWKAMPVYDEAHQRASAFLASRTPDDLSLVQAALRNAERRDSIMNTLDTQARAHGVSDARRAQMRGMLEHVTWRLANQPPSLVITEYVEKMEKLADSDIESEARQRQLTARLSEKVFWDTQTHDARHRRLTRGAKVFGVGAAIFAAGTLVVVAGAFPGVFVMTIGVLVMLVALIMLLVGLATPSAKK